MEYHHVTILAATTRPEKLEPAFRSRFFLTLRLKRYTDQEMAELMESQYPGAGALATAAAGNPRQAERIVATAKGLGTTDAETVLSTCRINADGLTETQLDYLRTLEKTKRPTGLEQLAVLIGVDITMLREAERYLLEKDLIALNTSGRALTRIGKAYVKGME
jgi:Holliday junction resolvasome RuvABC ATP-dependent DNA helicase subunit